MKLIDKSALVAEIERRINEINLNSIEDWRYRLQREHDIEVMKKILSFINTLEVKEVQEEPVSEDLEEAAKLHVIETRGEDVVWDENARCAMLDFKAGAKWQKEHMMVKAIDGTARPDDGKIWCDLKPFNFKDGDKVKLIVIKKD